MVSERTATPTGSPGLIKLLSKGLDRVTGRARSSAQSNGKDASPSPTQQSKVAGKASANEGTPKQQVQLEVNGESPDATEPVNHDMPYQSPLPSLDPLEEDVSGQPGQSSASPQHLSIVPFLDADHALPHAQSPFNSEAWPHQALQVAEQRPMPFKRSSDILDLIDSQLSGKAKRQRLDLPDPSGKNSLALLGPETGTSLIAPTQSPALLPANRSVTSCQSPVAVASPFRRHVAPLPSRLSRPTSAPFNAGRAPANSPAIPSSRTTRSKKKAAAGLQQHSAATPAKSPAQAFSKPSTMVKAHAFRLGHTDAQLPGSSLLMLPAPEPAGQTASLTDAQDPAKGANGLQLPAAFTPMKALQSNLAKPGADERTAEGTTLGPSSLLAAGLHVRTAAPTSTSTPTRARRFQGRAVPSAQKRKAADLEAPDPELEEAAESQRHRKQARSNAEDISNNWTQLLATAPPPTAVLGFTTQGPTHADKASSSASQTDAGQANVGPTASDGSQTQHADNTQASMRNTQPNAKDYGAPWVAAAAAPASQDFQRQVNPNTGAEGPRTTPPATSKLFGSLPIDSSPAAQVSPFLGGASFAPSPSTAPPKRPFSLLPDLPTSKPLAFPGFGASTSSAAASQPTAAAFETQAVPSQQQAAASEPNAAAPAAKADHTLPVAGNATAAASTAPKPAAEPSFPSLSFSTFSAQPSAQQQHLSFNFAAPATGTQLPEPEALQPQAHEAAVRSGKDKVEDAADRSNREASVSSDASGDTAVGEHLYPFSSQRSAQDRLEGLVGAHHLAANDTEGLYTFGQTGRSLADQNKPELPKSHQQDLPVTPLQNGVPTVAEADRLQAMAKAVPLPSPLASSPGPSPSHSDPGPEDREPSAEPSPSSGAQSPEDSDTSPDDDAASNDASAGTAVQDGNSAEASGDDEDDAGDAETIHVATDTEDPDAATIVLSSGSSTSLAEASGVSSGSSSSDDDVSSVGTTDDEAAAAEAPTPELAGASQAIPAAGWGSDFLKMNQAAARSAADAAADSTKTKDAPQPGFHAYQTPVPAAPPRTAFQAAAALPLPDDELPAPALQSTAAASQPVPAPATELRSVNMFEALAEPDNVAQPESSAQAAPTDNAGAAKPRRFVRRKQKP